MKSETRRHRSLSILKAGAVYFALVFGTGFIFGPIRILFIVPRFGVRWAELMEMPIMFVVIVLGANWVVRRFEIPDKVRDRLEVGLLALCLVLLIEFTLVLKLRGLTLADYFREIDPVSGTVYYLMLVVLAIMPMLVMRKRSPVMIG